MITLEITTRKGEVFFVEIYGKDETVNIPMADQDIKKIRVITK